MPATVLFNCCFTYKQPRRCRRAAAAGPRRRRSAGGRTTDAASVISPPSPPLPLFQSVVHRTSRWQLRVSTPSASARRASAASESDCLVHRFVRRIAQRRFSLRFPRCQMSSFLSLLRCFQVARVLSRLSLFDNPRPRPSVRRVLLFCLLNQSRRDLRRSLEGKVAKSTALT